ncbi:MAG: Flp family type IVb pilin [Xanthobacteraceae bacterium]
MRPLFRRFLSDQSAATAIEYALIAMGIAVAIVAVVQALGTTLAGSYQRVERGVDGIGK